MNKANLYAAIVLLTGACLVHSAFQMRNLRIKPEFLKPGQSVTVYFEAVHDYNSFVNVAGVFSLNNAVWDNTDDYLFLYNGGAGLTALNPPVGQVYAHRYMTPDQSFVGWYEYSWKTVVPATFTEGQVLTIIVKGSQQNMPLVTTMTAQGQLSITVEVATNKGVCYNTAKMNEKSSTDQLVIIDREPAAELTATPPFPGTDTVYTYTTPTLDVALWTNADSIHYTTDGTDPQNNPNATAIDTAGTTTISRDTVRLWALADGAAYAPTKKAWIYIRKLPSLTINAIPGDGTHFQTDTTIKLSVLYQGAPVTDATVAYSLDGSDPAVNGTPYTAPIVINRSCTLRAIASKTGYIPGTGSWNYIKDLIGTSIWAVPDSGTTFGISLSVSLFTNADSIVYTTDGSNPAVNGIAYSGAFNVSENISVVKGIAFGEDFDTASGLWIYYRDTVPKVIADPGTMQFTTSVNVSLSLSSPWPGAVIYYTLDGTNPDTNNGSTVQYGGTPIHITETTTLKAQAYANNAMPSEITTEHYTLVFGVVKASYLDRNGDGAIDRVVLFVNRIADKLPLEIVCTNPFDASDTKTITSASIAWYNNDASTKTIVADMQSQFPYCGLTGFTDDTYGRVTSGEYTKDPFMVNDSVAPVIDRATYCPGEIIDKNTLSRARDTLRVIFTEEITELGIPIMQPFKLITRGGTSYYFDLTVLSSNKNLVLFLVAYNGIHGVDFPAKGDSIWINASFGISDTKNITQTVDNNRHAELKVKPKPVCIVINPLIPFTPVSGPFSIPELTDISNEQIDQLVEQKGLLVIVDFLTDLLSVGHTITASMEIYDPLGNRVAFGSNTDSENGNVFMGVRDNKNLTQLIIYWPGLNLNNRNVGNSSYKAVLHISLTDPGIDNRYYNGAFDFVVGAKME